MEKQFKVLLAAFAVILSFASAQASAGQVKEWTYLVYMNGDNNLWPDAQANFAEMERVGSSPQVNVVVELDPEPSNLPTTRYLITKNAQARAGRPTSQVLQTLGETDMGDYKHLADFLSWGIKSFPARHYAVVIWNHGSGWQGISSDDHPRHTMTVPELHMALEFANREIAGQRHSQRGSAPLLDIVNFDACLMASMEVGFELRNVTQVLVGSQFLEPGEGEDYTLVLQPLLAHPQWSAQEFATNMVYQYSFRYAKAHDNAINYIALDLTKLVPFTGLFNQVATGIIPSPGDVKNKIMDRFNNPGDGGGFDLIGVMKGAEALAAPVPTLAQKIEQLIQVYGYPDDKAAAFNTGAGFVKAYNVVRYSPGYVQYRYSNEMTWKTVELKPVANGSYQAAIPAAAAGAQMQYVVAHKARGFDVVREAVTQLLFEGKDPIVFHTHFPANSPVIADSHNFRTKGAHGISLYSLAGMQAMRRGHQRLGEDLLSDYKKLQFASVGAPAWTQLFGF